MSKSPTAAEIVDEVVSDILAWVKETPKRQRRIRSATFWGYFGLKRRSREHVELIKAALRQHALLVNIDEAIFGTEDKGEWIVLSYIEPPQPPTVAPSKAPAQKVPTPPDSWFAVLASREFESEKEVEYCFVMPILEQLGYTEADIAIGFSVQLHQGAKKIRTEADVVLFNGTSRAKEDALLVIEAKRTGKVLTEDAIGQGQAYAVGLSLPYYLVTNGDMIRVYLYRGAISDVQLMSFNRADFRQHWPMFYRTLNRSAVIDLKKEWLTRFDG